MAITVALMLTSLLVVTAMVLDFGLARLDRQQVRSAADSAVMAGLRAGDGGADTLFTFRGVCGTLAFLRANRPELSGLPANACASPNMTATCDPDNPNDPATRAVYQGNVTSNGVTTEVVIKSPYLVSDGGFPEESLASLSSDPSAQQGCDQIGVIVTRSRKPALGSLATTGQLSFTQRSVGRVQNSPGERAPALLLLERTRCEVLSVGSAGAGGGSRIFVYGSGAVPATVHSDSSATGPGCGSGPNQQLFQGKQNNGVVAFGSSTGLSGTVTSVATANGVAPNVVSDSTANVYGTTALNESVSGTVSPVTARKRVTRRPIDERYLSGRRTAAITAHPQWNLNPATAPGYLYRYGCTPTAAQMTAMAAMTSSDSVYFDCPSNAGITLSGTVGAGRIYFHGFIKNSNLAMPNATTVYIDNTDNSGNRINSTAITLGTGNAFCVRSSTCTPTPAVACSTAPTVIASRAQLTIGRGSIETTGSGLLRMCNTSVLFAGGQFGNGTAGAPGACLPLTPGIAPTASPCPGAPSVTGDGYLNLSGLTDWTAPNRYGDMTALGMTAAQQQAAWNDGEDLALWTESYGTGANFKAAGGGRTRVVGVFMASNAAPLTIGGGGAQDLTNAQFIATSFAVDGGATLTMRVDRTIGVPLPQLGPFLLVR